MVQVITQPDSPAVGRQLQQRFDALGVTLVRGRRTGQARLLNQVGRVESAVVQSGPFREALRRRWDEVRGTLANEAVLELIPGVWVRALPDKGLTAPVEHATDGDRAHLAVLLTEKALDSEQFLVACDHAGLDMVAAKGLAAKHLVTEAEAARLGLTLGWLCGDDGTMTRRQRELQGLSSELADTYEELALLYRMSTSLRVNESAVDVLRDACDELHQVVGFSWVAFCLGHDDRLDDVNNATVMVSARDYDAAEVRSVADALTERLRDKPSPLILDDVAEMGVPGLSRLGKNLLVVPLIVEGKVLGVMFGGDRLDGEMLSSIDEKLCESFAGSLTIYLENHMLYGDAQSMFLGALHALTAAIDAKDSYTHGHSERVALLARMLAEDTGHDFATCERVYLSGLVHDVGKIGVPEAVLCKPGRLTDEEFGLIKLHPEIGANIIKDIRQMEDLVPGVLYHHERYDGRGYPQGLAGDDIPIFGRLIGLADAFDAMSSHRTYRKALKLEDVLAEIKRCAGAQFDPELANAFVAMDFEPFHQLIARHERLKKTA
ncbi:MAG: HD domain-containing phosphohydrolase [Planctomycetota bacterium]